MRIKYLITLLSLNLCICVFAKKPLDHDAFDSWQKLRNYDISFNGEWAAFSVEPQEGDAVLYLHNLKKGTSIAVPRGYQPSFSADSKWAVTLIKPIYADIRKAKIDKKKDLDAPQDSLAIINLTTGKIEKIANVKSYKAGAEGGSWLAYQSVDTIYAKKSVLNDKNAGKPLVIRSYDGKFNKVINFVDTYKFSKPGNRLAVITAKPEKDSIATNGVGVILLPDSSFYLIDRDKKFYASPAFDEKGTQLAYIAGEDSVKSGTKKLQVYLSDLSSPMATPREFNIHFGSSKGKHLRRPNPADDVYYPELGGTLLQEWQRRTEASRNDTLFINQYSEPEFSYDGKRLIVGVAPYIAPDDTTIVDFERADIDIWRWNAPLTPPQELKNITKLRKKQYPVVVDIATGSYILTCNSPYARVTAPDRWDADWALVRDRSNHLVESQWNYLAPEEISLINIKTGAKREIGVAQTENALLSPSDKYIIWYADRNFYTYSIEREDTACISKGLPYPIWEEEDDHPMERQPYGICGWSQGDGKVLIYDKYDIWVLDPEGKNTPVCLTGGYGRKNNLKLRFRNTDPDWRYFKPGELMLLEVFDYETKKNGLATIKYVDKTSTPDLRILEGATFTQIRKSKKAESFTWQRGAFDIAPNIWGVNSLNFSRAVQLSDANPQMKDYNWGTAQLFTWYAYNGKKSEGVLYLPEDFSPEKEYPMLAVFYETGSENLFYHFAMEPSWSWVNYPFYVSRGYVVFVPDIHYTTGLPGESAYNYVCSGVEAVCDMYPNIDRKRIGIDGQSWGGYQTAYLVTRTNMFACAGSGAPVANMTSAFGGIRWESGDSRQAQYEQGQSRIGGNLWEKRDLYIANSPLFHADKCNTPLLIMHNDADGAVPWYQGIELFMALRRLQKPVWMLQYNGEAHNIKERRNRKDITIRLQQFFDHYLKGDPMPRWMREGIPALRKGQDMGY